MRRGLTRRGFVALVGGAVAGTCRGRADAGEQARVRLPAAVSAPRQGRRPAAGVQPLGLADGRDATLLVPANAPATPLPLLVLLHGAGGNGGNMIRRLGAAADDAGVAVLAPDSRDPRTWDGVRGDLGPDVSFLNRAMARTLDLIDIDRNRLSIGGFSDGATYAITLGLINGDVFGRVVAWSPGFYVDVEVHGKPRFFVSHGRADEILPIDRCSRVLVPRLQKRGYAVTYREFDGGHTMPPDVIREGLQFATAP